MLVIRLLRTGKKNQPSFKVVVTDKRNPPRGGRFVEQVGTYNSLTKQKLLNKERIQYWISQGAQPSPTVHNLLVKENILEASKIPVHKKAKKKEESPESPKKPEPVKKEETKEQPPKEEPKKEEKTQEPPKQKTETSEPPSGLEKSDKSQSDPPESSKDDSSAI